MKNFTKLLLGSLVLFSLSGCTAGDMITSYTSTSDQSETTLQNTSGTPKQRVYMDEIKGTLKDFTGATLTMESQEQTYVFNLSEATLECEDGMITGDEISVIYEGQLSNKDTSTVKALKVVDDFHKKNQLEVRKAYGEVQSLTSNTITIKNKKGRKIAISWKKTTKAKAYQVTYDTSKKFKNKKTKKVTKSKITLTKLKIGKTYFIRVRAVTIESGKKVYSKWSKVKKIKVKK